MCRSAKTKAMDAICGGGKRNIAYKINTGKGCMLGIDLVCSKCSQLYSLQLKMNRSLWVYDNGDVRLNMDTYQKEIGRCCAGHDWVVRLLGITNKEQRTEGMR